MSRPRIIAGFGRSGTTWVQDVAAESNSLRTVFEPLHPTAMPGAADFALRYISRFDQDKELHDFLAMYLSQPFHSVWADYRVHPNWLFPWRKKFHSISDLKTAPNRFFRSLGYIRKYKSQRSLPESITKFIRANMMLSWLKENFDARIVLIVRHPAAVVLSQLNAISSWDPYIRIDRYREQKNLVDALDDRIRALLFEKLDLVEALTLAWCVENSIALRQAQESDILVIHYEQLLERGDPEWRKLLSALDLPVMPDGGLVAKPSQQAWGEHAQHPEAIRRYASWLDRIDSGASASIGSILDKAGVSIYRMDRALPVNVD